uniref:Uncharacterized protein n=1 Tax=Arundo donax TaxID=35708 RepID=A0A0A9E9L4_ARUDO
MNHTARVAIKFQPRTLPCGPKYSHLHGMDSDKWLSLNTFSNWSHAFGKYTILSYCYSC